MTMQGLNNRIPSLKRLVIQALVKQKKKYDVLPLADRVLEDNDDIFKEENSATIIQSRFRGNHTRTKICNMPKIRCQSKIEKAMVYSAVPLGACLLAAYSAMLLKMISSEINQYQEQVQECIKNDPQILGVYTDQQGITFDCILVCHPVNKDFFVRNYCEWEEKKYFTLMLAALSMPYVFLMGLQPNQY